MTRLKPRKPHTCVSCGASNESTILVGVGRRCEWICVACYDKAKAAGAVHHGHVIAIDWQFGVAKERAL